jgi:CheY-like chemotaxis protein
MSHTILIVEDDSELLSVFRQNLERADYRIFEASNGAQALEMLEQEVPDLIILDILMPAMSGETVLQRIQATPEWHAIKVVVVSAYPSFREKAMDLGADAFLVKPIKLDDMLKAVSAQLAD